jgi:transposase
LAATGVAPSATLVVLEATGSYWVALAVALHSAGYQVAVVNPAHVHNYAKSLPRRSKTDRLDAQLLTQFGLERKLETWTPPPEVYHDLRQRLVARDGLLTMRGYPLGVARNQLHALEQWPVRVAAVQQQMVQVIESLDEQVRTLEEAIAEVLADGAWAASAAHLQSIPGLGLVTAAWLVVGTVNFTTCATAEAAAHDAGLAPMERESGSSVRGRPSIGHGGNRRVRTALYMATLSAARYNPVIKRFYTRLREAGTLWVKPTKVARCAAARKMMHLAFAVVTKGQDFDPSYQKPPSSV